MPSLFAPVCSIARTQRRRYFWAIWISTPPSRVPFEKPYASNGGAKSAEEALREAEKSAGCTLRIVEPLWAKAWLRVLQGKTPWTSRDHALPASNGHSDSLRPERAQGPSIWTTLGLAPSASLVEIKTAYRQRALETHPDRGGTPEAFRAVQRAYELAIARASRAAARPKKRSHG